MQDALAHEDAALDQEQSTHALTVGVLAEPRTLFTEGEDILLPVSAQSRWRVRRHTTVPSPRTCSAACGRHSTRP